MSDLVVSSFNTTAEIKGAVWERDDRDSASGAISVRIFYEVNGARGSKVLLLTSSDPQVSDDEWQQQRRDLA